VQVVAPQEVSRVQNVVVINGSPRRADGATGMVLEPFVDGMREAGADVEIICVEDIQPMQCACGQMYCWYKRPGVCCMQDGMQEVYPRLRRAQTLVLATPVYIPLPGRMQDFINRLCPLIVPQLTTRDGRTRARWRDEVQIERIALVATGSWWEKANLETVLRIAVEIAESASIPFAGAALRPHAWLMRDSRGLTQAGQAVAAALHRAGAQLATAGMIDEATQEAISQPLIEREDLLQRYNLISKA